MATFNFSQLFARLLGRDEDDSVPNALMLDPLTQLPTRAAVVRELKARLQKANGRRPVALTIIDFTNVRGLVEKGETVDADLLRRLTKLMKSVAGDHVVGHLRDREFAMLMDGAPLTQVEHIADQIIEAVRNDTTLGNERRFISTIIGIGFSSKGDMRAPQLMALADIALHYALATGRGQHVIVDSIPKSRVA